MNILPKKPKFNTLSAPLNNRYFLMRHGESYANREGIIVSDPEMGTKSFGLTGKGTEQVIECAINTRLNSDTIIYSSDFLRAKETAETFAGIIDTPAIELQTSLRERYFGEWEDSGTHNYAKIWTMDQTKQYGTNSTIESTENVAHRTLGFVRALEKRHHNRNILLVSHGDTLQILMTAFAGFCPSLHRNLTPIKTAEIRSLYSKPLRSRSQNKMQVIGQSLASN